MKTYEVIVPVFTRLEETHRFKAADEEAAIQMALDREPDSTTEDADYYEPDKDNVRVKRVSGSVMADQLLQWQADLEAGDVHGVMVGLLEVVDDMERIEAAGQSEEQKPRGPVFVVTNGNGLTIVLYDSKEKAVAHCEAFGGAYAECEVTEELPDLVKDHARNKWRNRQDEKVQFARLLCELVANDYNVTDTARSMDLRVADINALLDVAHETWEAAKVDGPKKVLEVPDLGTFKECVLYDGEIAEIINSDDMLLAIAASTSTGRTR